MKKFILLLIVFIFCCFCLAAISVQAANKPKILYLPTSTEFFRTATPVYNWNLPVDVTRTTTPNFFTQTIQSQNTNIAASITPTPYTPNPTETEFLTETPTVVSSIQTTEPAESTSIPVIVGESRSLIKSDRYEKNNYWAIPIGVIATFVLIAAGILVITKHR